MRRASPCDSLQVAAAFPPPLALAVVQTWLEIEVWQNLKFRSFVSKGEPEDRMDWASSTPSKQIILFTNTRERTRWAASVRNVFITGAIRRKGVCGRCWNDEFPEAFQGQSRVLQDGSRGRQEGAGRCWNWLRRLGPGLSPTLYRLDAPASLSHSLSLPPSLSYFWSAALPSMRTSPPSSI